MNAKLKTYHLIGAIGGFLTVFTSLLLLAFSASYYYGGEMIFLTMLSIASNGLIATYCFGAFSASRDGLIKAGSLVTAIGLCVQMTGAFVFILAFLGSIVMMVGFVMLCIKFMMLFQRDAFVIVFCVFILVGLLLSIFWGWAGMISGAGLGGLLIYFYVHNITY